MDRRYQILGAIVVIIVLAGLFYFVSGRSFASFAPITGGTVTSLSYVKLLSNYQGINGSAWLADITLNGAGQNLTGFSAHQINQSDSTGTPVSINTKVTNYGYLFQYSTSPTQYLYTWKVQAISGVSFSYNCPTGVVCSQSVGQNGEDTFTMFWSPSIFASPMSTAWPYVQAAYVQACNSANGKALILTEDTLQVGSGTFVAQLECAQFQAQPLASIYTSYTFQDTFNATVLLTNGTKSYSTQISYSHPDSNIAGSLFVNLASYQPSGFNINQQQVPNVAQITGANQSAKGEFLLVNPITALSLLSGVESSNLPSGALIVSASTPQGNIYSNQTLVNINNLNTEATDYLYKPVNDSNPYARMNIQGFRFANPVGILNLTITPTFYANIQVIAKFVTLGVGVPVAKPIIQSVSPNPLTAGSATSITATFNVKNNGTVGGSVYISGSCGSSTQFTSTSSPTFIAGSSTVQVPVTIASPINPDNRTDGYNCQATAYSSSGSVYQSPTFAFTLGVNQQCAPGTVYVNPSTCQPIVNTVTVTTVCTSGSCAASPTTTVQTCRQGYTYASGACYQNATCSVGYVLNSSVVPPTCEPASSSEQGFGIGWYVVGFIVVVGVVYLVYRSTKKHHGSSRRRK